MIPITFNPSASNTHVYVSLDSQRLNAFSLGLTGDEDFHIPTSFDPCRRLCTAYSASGFGNGADLCDDPLGSLCDASTNICSKIFWSNETAERIGLVYEIDPQESTDLVPVTCHEAEEIVQRPAEWLGYDHDIDSMVESALVVFKSLPHAGAVEFQPNNLRRPIIRRTRMENPSLSHLISEFESTFISIARRTFTRYSGYRQHSLPPTRAIRERLPMAAEVPDLVSLVRHFHRMTNFDTLPVYNWPTPASSNGVLQRMVDSTDMATTGRLNRYIRVVNFDAPSTYHLTATTFRIGSDLYRLVAVGQQLDDNARKFTATFSQNGLWFGLSGSTVVLLPRNTRVFENVVTAFYTLHNM